MRHTDRRKNERQLGVSAKNVNFGSCQSSPGGHPSFFAHKDIPGDDRDIFKKTKIAPRGQDAPGRSTGKNIPYVGRVVGFWLRAEVTDCLLVGSVAPI